MEAGRRGSVRARPGPPASARLAPPLLAFALLAGCGDTRTWLEVAYDSRFGEATTMDVYAPGEGGGDRPAVLFVHGGSWRYFSKDAHAGAAERLARSGYVAATINYRLVPDGVFPRAYQDCACALAHFRAHAAEYGADPDRVAVVGYSAGGHLAALLAVAAEDPDPELEPDCAAGRPAPPAAAVIGSGPVDLFESKFSPVEDFLGGTAEEIPETFRLASPITHVRAGEPPFLFVHGTGDWLVDLEDQSESMAAALRAAGNDAEVLTLAGGGHLLNGGSRPGVLHVDMALETPEACLAVWDFLGRTVGRP